MTVVVYKSCDQYCGESGVPDVATRQHSPASDLTAKVRYFEVDFPEVFDYKLPVLQASGAVPSFEYTPVPVNLGLPEWENGLLQAGFEPVKPTLWILEGLTGYLTEEELVALMTKLSRKLSAPGSRIRAQLEMVPQRYGGMSL